MEPVTFRVGRSLGRIKAFRRGYEAAAVTGQLFGRLCIRTARIAAGAVVALLALWPADYVFDVLGRPFAALTLGSILGALVCAFVCYMAFAFAWLFAFGPGPTESR